MLHVTNGDYAAEAIRALDLPGQVLPWRDVLHEGPVPAGLPLPELSAVRARFIAGRGWGAEDEVARGFRERDAVLARSAEHEEVVLWFEHDLYDQLQLLQLLDWFSVHGSEGQRLTLVGADDYLTSVDAVRLREWFAERRAVTPPQLALARDAWAAFRGSDPRAIEHVLAADTAPLPHLAFVLRRHLEQFPGVRDGLSRSERQALAVLADGPLTTREAFSRSQEREEAVFLGDTGFRSLLADLGAPPHPLVAAEDGRRIGAPPSAGADVDALRVALTDAGRDVLAGRADRVRLNGIDRWLGGVHLTADGPAWRWDASADRIVRGDA